MRKRLLSILAALFILTYSFPQGVFADAFSSFSNSGAVCAQLPKTSDVLNLIDISKKISVKYFNMALDLFAPCFITDICDKAMQISPMPAAAVNSLKFYIFTGFLKAFKNRGSFIKFSPENYNPVILYDSDILISQILLRLKTVVKATAPSDGINTIILNKIYLSPACV